MAPSPYLEYERSNYKAHPNHLMKIYTLQAQGIIGVILGYFTVFKFGLQLTIRSE